MTTLTDDQLAELAKALGSVLWRAEEFDCEPFGKEWHILRDDTQSTSKTIAIVAEDGDHAQNAQAIAMTPQFLAEVIALRSLLKRISMMGIANPERHDVEEKNSYEQGLDDAYKFVANIAKEAL